VTMMYSGFDVGQMANSQSTCRPGSGPTLSWLETRQKEDHCQPVAVRLMTNGTGTPSERSDNGGRPFARGNDEPASPPSHIAFLYDRAQQLVKSPPGGMAECPNGGPLSPGEYRSLSRAVPAPVHHRHQQQLQQPTSPPDDATTEYNPFSRATPAPIQLHAAAAATQRLTSDSGTPTSPRSTQHGNPEPRAVEV